MLDNGAVVHVDSSGRVTMIVRPETWNGTVPRRPGDTPGQHGLGRDSAGIGLTWTGTPRALDGWLVLQATRDALAEAVGRLPIAEALRWTARLARATVESMTNRKQRGEELRAAQGGPDPTRQPSGAPHTPSPAAATENGRRAAARQGDEAPGQPAGVGHNGPPSEPPPNRPGTRRQPPEGSIGAAAADALMRASGVVYVGTGGDAEVVLTVAGRTTSDGQSQGPAGAWDPWGTILPLRSHWIAATSHELGGLTWSTVRMRAVGMSKTIGTKTRDMARCWVRDLARADTEGRALRDRANALDAERKKAEAEAARARDAAQANTAGETAAKRPVRRGRGRRDDGMGI